MSNHSRLDAVNMMLAEVYIPRVSALDSTGSWPTKTHGSSPEGNAEYYLDLWTRAACAKGLDSRCKRNQSFNTGGGTISLGSRAIKVAGKASLENRDLRVDNATGSPLLYDNEAGSTTFAAGTYFLDVWDEAPFEELTLVEQQLILADVLPKFAAISGGKSLTVTDMTVANAEVMNTTDTRRSQYRKYREPLIPQPRQQ